MQNKAKTEEMQLNNSLNELFSLKDKFGDKINMLDKKLGKKTRQTKQMLVRRTNFPSLDEQNQNEILKKLKVVKKEYDNEITMMKKKYIELLRILNMIKNRRDSSESSEEIISLFNKLYGILLKIDTIHSINFNKIDEFLFDLVKNNLIYFNIIRKTKKIAINEDEDNLRDSYTGLNQKTTNLNEKTKYQDEFEQNCTPQLIKLSSSIQNCPCIQNYLTKINNLI